MFSEYYSGVDLGAFYSMYKIAQNIIYRLLLCRWFDNNIGKRQEVAVECKKWECSKEISYIR